MPWRKTKDRLHEFHCVNRSNNGETKEKQKNHKLQCSSQRILLVNFEVQLSSFNTAAIQYDVDFVASRFSSPIQL